MQKKKSPIIVCSILFAVIIIAQLTYMFLNPMPHEYYIFQDIQECEQLISAVSADAKVEQHDSPKNDKHLKTLTYSKFRGFNVESDTLKYEIFAYEFEDAYSAMQYFSNVTGKTIDKENPSLYKEKNFSVSKGMTSLRIVIVSQNRAYKLVAPNQCDDEVFALLASTFSQKLP